MYGTIKKAALLISALLIFFFVLFVINQTAQVVELASHLSPGFGTALLWFLIGLYALLLIGAALFFLRLPEPLHPPRSEAEPHFSRHLDALRKRLAVNPRLKGADLSTRSGIQKGLQDLGSVCDGIIRSSAEAVFVTTAISQSGRLDAMVVLAANFRMILRIAGIYMQRPALRDLLYLYANVAGTAFAAVELDETEIGDQVEPILSSALGALSLSIPGVQAASSLVVTSILTGAANAFLTLRVGVIARRYCGALVLLDRRALRRSATAESAKLLGAIVKAGTTRISKALWNASLGKVGGVFSGFTGMACDLRDSLMALLKGYDGKREA